MASDHRANQHWRAAHANQNRKRSWERSSDRRRGARRPPLLRSASTSPHLHPNDAGYQAMADAVDLSTFTGKRAAAAPAKR
jgi:lysophospholipase L1-like esterase